MARAQISIDEARRIALHAQGFGAPRPRGRVSSAHVRKTIERLGLLQIDYVNILVPAHYLVLFSRLGSYDRSLLDRLVYRKRAFVEQWAHAASFVPMSAWPLLAHRRAAFPASPRLKAFVRKHAAYVDHVLAAVRERGPLCADDLDTPPGVARHTPGAWRRSVPRIALEYHFGQGRLVAADRGRDLARSYDLPEKVVPADLVHSAIEPAEAQRELLERAARAHGVATAADLSDYWRMSIRDARPRIAELVESGRLVDATVEGLSEPAFLSPKTKRPRSLHAASLLSPFDPVVWTRGRGSWLFDFDYLLEIFVPAKKRTFGYYVLPFLWGDRPAARVDLAAERKSGILEVRAAHYEPWADPEELAAPLARELWAVATWLDLGQIRIGRRGKLSRPLRSAIRDTQP